MPYRRFKALRQWGRFNTALYKDMYSMRMRRKLPRYNPPQHLLDSNTPIYDPNDPDFPNSPAIRPLNAREEMLRRIDHPAYFIPDDTDHPYYHATPAYIFDGEESLSAGVEQAANLTKTIIRHGLPSSVFSHDIDYTPCKQRVAEAIMDAHSFDGSLLELPPRPHEIIWWRETEDRKLGVTQERANWNLLRNLVRACISCNAYGLLSLLPNQQKHLRQMRVIENSKISVAVDIGHELNRPFVVRSDNVTAILDRFYLTASSSDTNVMDTQDEKVVDLHPIDPLIDAKLEHVYKAEHYYPDMDIIAFKDYKLSVDPKRRYLHTLLTQYHHTNLKYPWTDKEILANALLVAFAGAVALAEQLQRTDDYLARRPVTVQCIQMCPDGYLNYIIYELTTLAINDKQKGLKNIAYIDRDRLFEPYPIWDNFTDVKRLNMQAFGKFAAMITRTSEK